MGYGREMSDEDDYVFADPSMRSTRRAPAAMSIPDAIARQGPSMPAVRVTRAIGHDGRLFDRVHERVFPSALIPVVSEGWRKWDLLSPDEKREHVARLRGEIP